MRITPSNLAVFAGPSSGSGISEIFGIKSLDFNSSIGVLETNVYGKNNDDFNYPGFTEPKLSFSYYCDGFQNEKSIGLSTGMSSFAGKNYLLNNTTNFYVFTAPRGYEAKGLGPADGTVLALGDGFLSSYSVSAAIGSYPSVSVEIDFLNASSHANGVSFENPSVYNTGFITTPSISGSAGRKGIVRPGEIQMSISGGFFQSNDSLIQSFKLDFQIDKENVSLAGSRYPKRNGISPIKINLSVDVLSSRGADPFSLSSGLCYTGVSDMSISFHGRCNEFDFISQYSLSGMKYNGESNSASQGSNITTLSWIGQMSIGAGDNGLSLAGVKYYYLSPSGEYYISEEGDYYVYYE